VPVRDADRVSFDEHWSGVVERHCGVGPREKYYQTLARVTGSSVEPTERCDEWATKENTITLTDSLFTRDDEKCRPLRAESGLSWHCGGGGGSAYAIRETCHGGEELRHDGESGTDER